MGAPAVEDIARVLLRDWDPLGVAESDEAPEEEYRFEARELSAMLAQGTSAEWLTTWGPEAWARLIVLGIGRPLPHCSP